MRPGLLSRHACKAASHVVLVQASHLQEKDNFALLEQARIIYSAGFFLTASPESMLIAAKHAAANNKIYCVNISAPFLLLVRFAAPYCISCGLTVLHFSVCRILAKQVLQSALYSKASKIGIQHCGRL